MDDKINLAEELALLDTPYAPGIVGYLHDYKDLTEPSTPETRQET